MLIFQAVQSPRPVIPLVAGLAVLLLAATAPAGHFRLFPRPVAIRIRCTSCPLNPINAYDPKNPLNPINQYDPGNPANPMNQYNPSNPYNPLNQFNPKNPLNPINEYNPSTPFSHEFLAASRSR